MLNNERISLSDHEDNFSSSLNRTNLGPEVQQIALETKWVDDLQKQLEYGNDEPLQNFKLLLVIEG
jgi:hypothetical protein